MSGEFLRHNRTCDATQPFVRHDAFACVTWLILSVTRPSHMCDTTHSCMWHDSAIYVTRLMVLNWSQPILLCMKYFIQILLKTFQSWHGRAKIAGAGRNLGVQFWILGGAFFFAGLSCWAFCGAEPCKRSPCKKPRKRNRARIPGFSWNLWLVPCHYPALIVNAMGGILVRQHSFRNNLEILWHPIYFWLHVYI